MNKAETVISVTAHNNGSSVVGSDYSRYIPFNDFAFRINEEGLPESCSIPRSTTGTQNSSRPHTIEDAIHLQVLDTIFEDNHDLRYTLFWNTIRDKFHQEGILNRSAQHVDIVTDFRPGGVGKAVYLDDVKLEIKDNIWVVPGS